MNGTFKVAVLGAAGGIGQPLSLLLKNFEAISTLALYDVIPVAGLVADLSHCCTSTTVSGYSGLDQLPNALEGAHIVVIPAGVPRKPGMTRDDLFNINASIIFGLGEACARHCPNAHFLLISNPLNSLVPLFAEVLKQHNVYNPRRLYGITTLDIVRAKTFIAERQGLNPANVEVDVIGGHAGTTILPLLSKVPGVSLTESDIEQLSHRIQFGGDEVVQAKNGAGSATLSMAYAAVRFVHHLLIGLTSQEPVRECAYVQSSLTDSSFFASPILLGNDGIQEILDFRPLSQFEQKIFDEMLPTLIQQIEKGVSFAHEYSQKK